MTSAEYFFSMNSLNEFKRMINNLTEENLSELCEQFLFDHEGAMKTLSKYCNWCFIIYYDFNY